MVAKTCRTFPMALGLFVLAILPATANAQGNTFNPYGNSGYADYREFGNATYSNNPALPGQARLDSQPLIERRRANSFRQYLDETDSENESNSSRSKAGNRAYKANANPQNQELLDRLKQRDEAYAKALQEKDPVKRAKLLRQIENESVYTSTSKTKSATTSKAPDPSGVARGSATSRAPAPPGERRSAAPPSDGSSTRRSAGATPPPPPINGSSRPRSGSTGSSIGPAPDPSTIAVPPPR